MKIRFLEVLCLLFVLRYKKSNIQSYFSMKIQYLLIVFLNSNAYQMAFKLLSFMQKITNTQELKRNFLEVWKECTNEDREALVNFEKIEYFKVKLEAYLSEEFTYEKVLLAYHSYASIAYVTAELKVNSKVYLDFKKEKFMILSYKKNSNPDTCSLVYSNIPSLCQYPFFPVPVMNIIDCIESNDVINKLVDYYNTHAK